MTSYETFFNNIAGICKALERIADNLDKLVDMKKNEKKENEYGYQIDPNTRYVNTEVIYVPCKYEPWEDLGRSKRTEDWQVHTDE